MTVMVKKLGGSIAVVIPKVVARDMGLTDGTPLDISTSADTIVMRKSAPRSRERRSMKLIVDQIRPAHYRRRRAELEGAGRVGKEIW